MNLKDQFLELKNRKNSYLSTGDLRLDAHMGGLTSKAIHIVAAQSKVGKSKWVNTKWVIEPYLDNIAKGKPFDLKCAYYSFEMDKASVQFEFAAYFFYRDYGITTFEYTFSNGQKKEYHISARYLQSNLLATRKDGKIEKVEVSKEHQEILFKIIDERIEPMFTDYIWFQEKRTNPTGINNDIWEHMKTMGEIKYETYYSKKDKKQKKRVVGFVPHNPNLLQTVVIDHVRKIKPEVGAVNTKDIIDKFSDYAVRIRNIFGVSFFVIVHLNRSMADVERQKHQGDKLYPSASSIKDSGNLSEDGNFVWTLFNPTDEQYGLKTHFGNDLSKPEFEHVRTLHLVEARTAECPSHFGYNFNGAQGVFTPIIKK